MNYIILMISNVISYVICEIKDAWNDAELHVPVLVHTGGGNCYCEIFLFWDIVVFLSNAFLVNLNASGCKKFLLITPSVITLSLFYNSVVVFSRRVHSDL